MAKYAAICCQVHRIEYDHKTHTGQLFMEHGHCCDMSACIVLFRLLDNDVALIYTFSGERPDTAYVKNKNEWTAVLPKIVVCDENGVPLDDEDEDSVSLDEDSVSLDEDSVPLPN